MGENDVDKETADNVDVEEYRDYDEIDENYDYDDDEEYSKDYDNDDGVSPLDAIHAVGEIVGEYKKAYDVSPKKDKMTMLAIFLPLAITFVLGFIGIALANTGQAIGLRTLEVAGFVCMGVGLGGFFLTIVIILIWNKTRR